MRELVEVFDATLSDTLPFPEPEAPELTVIQALLLTAVHEQLVVAVTVTEKLPPAEVGDWLVGEML